MHELSGEETTTFVQWVIESTETDLLETKRVSGSMINKALATICAFANTKGGWLVLGVEDYKKATGQDRLYGIEENLEAVDELLRKVKSHLIPMVDGVQIQRIPCKLRDQRQGFLLELFVPPSDKVHSVVDGNTWIRYMASNRAMTANEITDLSYKRGVRSAESESVDVDFALLNTNTWRLFLQGRGLSGDDLPDQLLRLGLAKKVDHKLQPLRAAVLLFADEPGALLAGLGSRADVRIFHYHGDRIERGEVPNLKKAPKTISGPLSQQITQTHLYVLNELAAGFAMANSGFHTIHHYPERVIKEAITNAIIHRDYRLNRDIQIRIFDDHIEILSPGLFPGRINAANIHQMGSLARNTLIARNIREFPEPPNVDAGEGVPMMFNLMRASNLYPPLYRELSNQAQEAVSVILFNEERPPVWEQVSDWIERKNGPIANADLCRIAKVDTLKASRMLKGWVGKGLLEPVPGRSKRHMAYRKPIWLDIGLLSISKDNKENKP